ncbi:hypothetical protein F5Y13DRAFT_166964 [Hypoxylon sp. FL1857]|nr:hypothetical protein F5Y13DRAFT_166964 [Hypoxylon sp. FL1857]
MAPAVTPGRNRVEAAEIYSARLSLVSRARSIYLVLRMVRRWPFRNLVRPWEATTGASGVLAKRWVSLPYATGTTAAAAPWTLELARPFVDEVMMINRILSPVAPGKFPGINVLDTRSAGQRTIHCLAMAI